jgi:mono/diheme cytochrome c family protein
MPPVPQKSADIPEPPPLTASADTVDHGRRIFNEVCGLCHGLLAVSSGVVSDLRFASPETHASWEEIVRGGSLRNKGMASFRDLLSTEDAEAVRAYVISRAIEDRSLKATTDSGMP